MLYVAALQVMEGVHDDAVARSDGHRHLGVQLHQRRRRRDEVGEREPEVGELRHRVRTTGGRRVVVTLRRGSRLVSHARIPDDVRECGRAEERHARDAERGGRRVRPVQEAIGDEEASLRERDKIRFSIL